MHVLLFLEADYPPIKTLEHLVVREAAPQGVFDGLLRFKRDTRAGLCALPVVQSWVAWVAVACLVQWSGAR